MKPEITLLYGAGKHNETLDASAARIMDGKAWKKQSVIRIRPGAHKISAKVADYHEGLMYPPNQKVARLSAYGMEVGAAYSECIEQVLARPDLSDFDYILTIETDNCPPADGLLRLLKQMDDHPEFACIGGLYWTKGEGGVPQIWGDPADPVLNFRPQPPKPGELVECCGTGMGFNLWRLSMFKDERLRKPWFKTVASAEEGIGTQDLWFWADARKHGYRCAVDCSVLVGHEDAEGFVW